MRDPVIWHWEIFLFSSYHSICLPGLLVLWVICRFILSYKNKINSSHCSSKISNRACLIWLLRIETFIRDMSELSSCWTTYACRHTHAQTYIPSNSEDLFQESRWRFSLLPGSESVLGKTTKQTALVGGIPECQKRT